MTQNKRAILATGGTGGHIFPALALKDSLQQNKIDTLVTGDARFAKFHPFDDQHIFIPAANFTNKHPINLFKTLLSLTHGFFKSLLLIYKYNPEIVIGFGGYASFPMMLAAIILRKKIILHEANTVIGKVNKLLLGQAKYLTTGFKDTQGVLKKYQNKVVFTGNPVRAEIISASLKENIIENKLSILIIGGSQGAKVFSKMIPASIINLPKAIKDKLHICQQVKEEDITLLKEKYAKEGISCEINSFFSDMSEKLSKANLVIARAGASTIAEIIEFNLPAIFIPYPSAADDHQHYNAKAIVDAGGGWIVKESKDSHIQLLQIIKSIEQDNTILEKFSENLKTLQQDACKNILSLMLS